MFLVLYIVSFCFVVLLVAEVFTAMDVQTRPPSETDGETQVVSLGDIAGGGEAYLQRLAAEGSPGDKSTLQVSVFGRLKRTALN